MNNCNFIGGSEKIHEVYSEKLRSQMVSRGMNTDVVFTKEFLEKNPDSAHKTEYIFSTWGMPHFTEEEIKLYFPSLKAVFYAAGSVQGFAPEFINCGIKVFSAWAANAVPVAEYTTAQIILANKGFFGCTSIYRTAGDRDASYAYAHTLPGNYGAYVGIIGAGMIGKQVINRLKSYNLNVLVFDPFLSDEKAAELNVEKCGLPELFRRCQTISNHLANNNDTYHMLDYSLFSLMKPNAVFINTGRGAQVVEEDLIRALNEEPHRFAILDVTCPEPPAEDSEFYRMPNIILTPHIAGSFSDELQRMSEYMFGEYENLVSGKPVNYSVTAEMLKTMA